MTSDNPRSEAPDAIIDAVMSGVGSDSQVLRESDRRAAIALAIASARAGDVVVLAGKGHESTQTVGELVIPLDDREIAREQLEEYVVLSLMESGGVGFLCALFVDTAMDSLPARSLAWPDRSVKTDRPLISTRPARRPWAGWSSSLPRCSAT